MLDLSKYNHKYEMIPIGEQWVHFNLEDHKVFYGMEENKQTIFSYHSTGTQGQVVTL